MGSGTVGSYNSARG